MKRKFALRKIISYLLLFTMLLGGLQSANMRVAKADTQTADRTFADQIILKSDLEPNKSVIVDTVSGKLTYEKINLATQSFSIEGNTGYRVTGVTYPTSLTETKGTSSNNTPKYQYAIKEYSNFTFIISVESLDGTIKNTYSIDMKYDMDALFQFDTIDITYTDIDGKKTPSSISYNEKDSDGYYRSDSVGVNTTKAKINLISGSYIMTQGVQINGNAPGSDIDLVGGDNYITITITRNNASKEYNLIINKKGQALLKSLVPSTGSLSPVFDENTVDYTITVPTTQTTIAFVPTSIDNSSTIKVGKYVVKSGKKSSEINLSEGTNKISITVTTKENESLTYTVNVVRTAKFRSANLTSLTLSSGTLNPVFNKDIYTYTGSVENTVSSITLTAVAEDPESTIRINDVKIPSGATSGNINLDEGGNLITVTVTDTKGNSNTYTLNITRKYSKDNVNLNSLSVTDGTMSPKFDPETYAYSVNVARNIEKVRILFKSQNEKAKVIVNGKEYTSGQQSDYINLEIGANLSVIQVVAEDGTTTTTYKLSIIRGDIEGTNQWVLVAGEWTFYNAEGLQIKNQWVKYDNQWYYLDINGFRKTGWLSESGKYYYLNKDGIMQTSWFYDKGYWYYLQGDGSMRSNDWATYDGKWYYFNNFGEMSTGWAQYKGKWYYMDDHGVMQKGWVTYDKNKYYLNDDGSMRYGWLYNGRTWCYLDGSGKMIRGWQVIDGRKYYFDANGTMKTGMMFLDGQWINLNNV